MEPKVTTYVQIDLIGDMVLEEGEPFEVAKPDPFAVEVPPRALRFRFYDIASTTVELGDPFDGETIPVKSDRIHETPFYYCGGTLHKKQEIGQGYEPDLSLLTDMEEANSEHFVVVRGAPFILREGDVYMAKGGTGT